MLVHTQSSSSAPIRVAVFELRPVLAEGLAALLSDAEGIEVVGVTTRDSEVVRITAETGVQVVVFGFECQGSDQVRGVLARIAAAAAADGRRVGMIGVSSGGREAAGDGLPTVLAAAASPSSLRDAIIGAVPRGDSATALRLVRRRAAGSAPAECESEPRLTERELQVLRGIEKGQSTKEIATELGITVNTVRTHVQHLMPKLGVHSRLQAAALGAGTSAQDGDARRDVRP